MLILASSSEIRAQILRNSGVSFEVFPAQIDEQLIKNGLISEQARSRDIADILAETKARKISMKFPTKLVLGCDQVLEFDAELLSKAKNREDLKKQLLYLRGKKHKLHSAMVLALGGHPIWRYIGEAQMVMREFSDFFLDQYISENYDLVKHSVGGYQIEGIGSQLIEDYRGDYFSILGLPLFPLLEFLRGYGELER